MTPPTPRPLPLLLSAALAVCACADSGASPSSTGDATTATTTATTTAATTAATTTTPTSTGAPDDTGASSSTGAPYDPTLCWTDLAFGAQEDFYKGFAGGSEGIAFGADGRLYVTTEGTVWQLNSAGEASVFAEMPDPVGLAGLADGGFIVASFGESQAPDGSVYRIDAGGNPTMIAAGIDDANFITIAPDGSALVSDAFDTRVFRVTLAGEVSVVLNVDSPNGMAYGPDGKSFFVASTFTTDAQVTRFDVDADGAPIEATGLEILHLGPGSTPDGIAVSADNQVYVAANLGGAIWRVDGAASEMQDGELVASLKFPASLAFGRGPGFDPCSLFVTQLAADGVIRVAVGSPGAPLYD